MKRTTDPFSRIIFIFGPTGVGKTELLTSLSGERYSVINADSIQIYRGLDIGSAKADSETLKKIHHYMIDVCDPDVQFTVADFIEKADEACIEIASQGKIPVICGGTAYYFKHFLYGMSSSPKSDPETRAKVDSLLDQKGADWMYDYLEKIDPVSHARINRNDIYRITRAIEVYMDSGRPLSSFEIPSVPRYGMKPLVIGLRRPKDEMDRRMALRCEIMKRDGLFEEIRSLMKKGARYDWPGMQGIGYREFFQAIEHGEWTPDAVLAEIVRNSRMYAKRQMTFFQSFADVQWFNPALQLPEILALIEEYSQLPASQSC